jgi:predicted nucleotidyltransferase component of viral defense system
MAGLTPNIGASVRQRLLNRARARGIDYSLLLLRFLNERVLYRLSRSPHRDSFVLKGAMTFDLWVDAGHRPTRDIDLLGFGQNAPDAIAAMFREILATEVEPDGLEFDLESVQAERIAEADRYPGVRVSADAWLTSARLRLHIDVGFGDVVTPEPSIASLPTLLGFPAPEVRVYPPETVVAEKFEAMVDLGIANTRMKDFYDIWLLADTIAFARPGLASAIRATFLRRGTPLPTGEPPLALTQEFTANPEKAQQWQAFLSRTGLDAAPTLGAVVEALQRFLLPVLRDDSAEGQHWDPESWTWRV